MKKILIGVGALAVIIAVGLYFANNRNRTLSPPGKAEITAGDLTISIPYSRPSVRGRVIFGTKESGALLPNGVYWRLGANEATEITINRDVNFNGMPVKAGTYRMYSFPGETSFEIRLNTGLGKWGYFDPDFEKDILTTMVPVQRNETSVEQYTIRIEPTENGADIIIEFANMRLVIPITRS